MVAKQLTNLFDVVIQPEQVGDGTFIQLTQHGRPSHAPQHEYALRELEHTAAQLRLLTLQKAALAKELEQAYKSMDQMENGSHLPYTRAASSLTKSASKAHEQHFAASVLGSRAPVRTPTNEIYESEFSGSIAATFAPAPTLSASSSTRDFLKPRAGENAFEKSVVTPGHMTRNDIRGTPGPRSTLFSVDSLTPAASTSFAHATRSILSGAEAGIVAASAASNGAAYTARAIQITGSGRP
jgi:hypothetical protein